MGDIGETTAMKKTISIFYQARGMTARKTIANKFPTTNIARITLTELLKNCKEGFEKTPKNETSDRFKFLSLKQQEGETLRYFWNEMVEANISPQHLKECKAMGVTCMKCGKRSHFACCQTK